MDDLVYLLVKNLAYVSIIAPIAVGAWGLLFILTGRLGAGGSGRRAATAACIVGLVTVVAAILILPPIVAWSPSPFTWTTIFAMAGGAGALMALSGIGGYALLALRVRQRAIAGLILGPLLLIGGPLVAGPALAFVAHDALARGYENSLSGASTFIRIRPTNVTSTSSNGHISTIDIAATVTSTHRVTVREDDPGDPSISFAVRHVGSASPGWGASEVPTIRVLGDPTSVELHFAIFATGDDDSPGPWELILNCIGTDQVSYRVSLPIVLSGGG